jgi:hydrogenase maturation protease
VRDFGTGGLKLAYDLMKGYDALILLDASKRGEQPGTLYVLEPDEKEFDGDLKEGSYIDPHSADPITVLRFVKAMDAWPAKVLIIACEPASVDDFQIGLSEPVEAAIEDAMKLVETSIEEIFSEN